MVTYTFADAQSAVKRALRLVNQTDIDLMKARINVAHRDLCQLAPWSALYAEETVTPSLGVVTPANGIAGVCFVEAVMQGGAKTHAWFIPNGDQYSDDLRGRCVWAMEGNASVKVMSVDPDTGAVGTDFAAAVIGYWKPPAALSADTDALALPSIRALTARVVEDCIGLMDRKEVDANPWRAEFQQGMKELSALAVQQPLPPLRLMSGRVLTRAPIYPIFTLAAQQPQEQQQQ